MKALLTLMLLLALLSAFATAQQQEQGSWNNYQARTTLQSIIDAHRGAAADLDADATAKNKLLLSADNFPSKVTLVYLGKSRPMTAKRKELLKAWQKMLKDSIPAGDVLNIFATEMLFKDGDQERWIAVQQPFLKPIPEEVKTGGKLTAYVIWMGAVKDGANWEWLFAMNRFDD